MQLAMGGSAAGIPNAAASVGGSTSPAAATTGTGRASQKRGGNRPGKSINSPKGAYINSNENMGGNDRGGMKL